MLNLHQLEIFTIVAHVGKISGAAEQLYISQSAVSQHIQELEASLGVKLFERSRRGVTLTTTGELLYDYAKDILNLVAEAENAVTNIETLESGQITIGGTPTIGVYTLPAWVHAFRQHYPNLTSTVQTGITGKIIEDVLARKLDIGFVEGELTDDYATSLQSLILKDIPQVLVVGQNHTWWQAKHIQIDDLNNQPFVMRQAKSKTRIWIEKLLQQYDIQPRITGEFDNPESIKHAVISGACVTILPDYAIQREIELGLLRIIPVDNLDMNRSLKLIWDSRRPFTPVTNAFLRYLSGQFPQILGVVQPQKRQHTRKMGQSSNL